MKTWKVRWFDGMNLRETLVQADPWSLISVASGAGVMVSNIFSIELLPH